MTKKSEHNHYPASSGCATDTDMLCRACDNFVQELERCGGMLHEEPRNLPQELNRIVGQFRGALSRALPLGSEQTELLELDFDLIERAREIVRLPEHTSTGDTTAPQDVPSGSFSDEEEVSSEPEINNSEPPPLLDHFANHFMDPGRWERIDDDMADTIVHPDDYPLVYGRILQSDYAMFEEIKTAVQQLRNAVPKDKQDDSGAENASKSSGPKGTRGKRRKQSKSKKKWERARDDMIERLERSTLPETLRQTEDRTEFAYNTIRDAAKSSWRLRQHFCLGEFSGGSSNQEQHDWDGAAGGENCEELSGTVERQLPQTEYSGGDDIHNEITQEDRKKFENLPEEIKNGILETWRNPKPGSKERALEQLRVFLKNPDSGSTGDVSYIDEADAPQQPQDEVTDDAQS